MRVTVSKLGLITGQRETSEKQCEESRGNKSASVQVYEFPANLVASEVKRLAKRPQLAIYVHI